MAQVDFSNAHIEPYNINPAEKAFLTLNIYNSGSIIFCDSNGNSVVSSQTMQTPISTPTRTMFQYSGIFSTSGTEFYFKYGAIAWRVYGITFASGDTFVFTVDSTLTY